MRDVELLLEPSAAYTLCGSCAQLLHKVGKLKYQAVEVEL